MRRKENRNEIFQDCAHGNRGAALAVLLLVPKSAHALVATLVQVVNITANPVPNLATERNARIPYQSGQGFVQSTTGDAVRTINVHRSAVRLPVSGSKRLCQPDFGHWVYRCIWCAERGRQLLRGTSSPRFRQPRHFPRFELSDYGVFQCRRLASDGDRWRLHWRGRPRRHSNGISGGLRHNGLSPDPEITSRRQAAP